MKTVIITGANGNLGKAVTKEFLDKNYQVIATVSNEKNVPDFESHVNLRVVMVNLSDEKETAAFIESMIREYGLIDAALLLAGGFVMGSIVTTAIADIHKQIAINFETAYNVTRPLFAHMMKNTQGHIVFIGARPALNPAQGKNLVAYSLGKSLLFRLAEMLNEEARGINVRVSVIVPSTLDTPLSRQSMPDVNPGDWVSPSEIAGTLEFLISDHSKSLKEVVLKMYNNA